MFPRLRVTCWARKIRLKCRRRWWRGSRSGPDQLAARNELPVLRDFSEFTDRLTGRPVDKPPLHFTVCGQPATAVQTNRWPRVPDDRRAAGVIRERRGSDGGGWRGRERARLKRFSFCSRSLCFRVVKRTGIGVGGNTAVNEEVPGRFRQVFSPNRRLGLCTEFREEFGPETQSFSSGSS